MTIQQQLQDLADLASEPRYVTLPSGALFPMYDPKSAEINGVKISAYRVVQDRQNTRRAKADRIRWYASDKVIAKADLLKLLGL
jgi:hypothetical protein